MNAYVRKVAGLLVLAVLGFGYAVPAHASHLQAGQMTKFGDAGPARES